jgi:hypothetical protein
MQRDESFVCDACWDTVRLKRQGQGQWQVGEVRRQKSMREIRLRWSKGQTGENGEPRDGGLWHPDTPENRETLEKVMDAGNETYGLGTHWIEEREA